MTGKSYLLTWLALLAILINVGGATAQPYMAPMMTTALRSTFTHEGHLKKNGSPFYGTCNMRFKLYDALSGGVQLGGTLTRTGVVVDNGLFTVQLDFGSTVFSGSDRYLETAVDCNDGSYTTLSPRQALTPAPYASHATSAEQLVKEFIVAPGENISAGDVVSIISSGQVVKGAGFGPEAVFNPGETLYMSAAALSSSQFVLVYQDNDNSGFGTAIIGTVSGNDVTFGSETVFNATGFSNAAVATLSPTKFVVAYRVGGGTTGIAVIGTISGDTITFGPETVFDVAGLEALSVVAISATQFVVVYRVGTGNIGTAIVGTVSGSTITLGTETLFNTDFFAPVVATALSPTQFVVADSSGAVVGTVSGTNITFGPATGHTSNPSVISIDSLSPTRFVIGFVGVDDFGYVALGTVSGDAITFSPATRFHNPPMENVSVSGLSPTQFAVAYLYRVDPDAYFSAAVIGTLVDNSFTFGPETSFNLGVQFSVGAVPIYNIALSPTQFVINYRDSANLNFGTSIIGTNIIGLPIGTANSSATGGASLPVIVGGVSDFHSDLTTGALYYAEPDGTLTTAVTTNLIGLAISPTEILLRVSGK